MYMWNQACLNSTIPSLFRFTDVDENVTTSLRSPSRLGYTDEISPDAETDNGSQESARDKLQLKLSIDTKETGQQTDNIGVLSPSPGSPHHLDLEPRPTNEYISSKKYFLEAGLSPKRPFEKTVFYVKSVPGEELTKKKEEFPKGDKCGVTNVLVKPISSARIKQVVSHPAGKERIDSGYASRQENRRVQLSSAKSVSTVQPSEGPKSSTMSLYGTEIYSPPSSSRKQEKEDLQVLNERFTAYIQKIRQQSDQNVRIDAGLFMQQTQVLEQEVANLKTMYERELDALR